MKKWMLAAVLGCLLLCGCDRTEAPSEPVSPPAEEVPSGGMLTQTGQAVTLQAHFSRTAIIGRNERVEGSFMQTQTWALEYAAREYPNYGVQVTYVSGYQAPRAMFKDDLRAGVAQWRLDLTAPDGDSVSESVQVFYFTETAESVTTQCLSGMLVGEDMLERRPESYAYLSLDTRFVKRMQTIALLEAPEGALTKELDFFAPEVLECQTWMLSDTAVVALVRYQDGNCGLLLHDLSRAFEPRYQALEGIWNYAQLEAGVLTLEQYAQTGARQLMTITMQDGQSIIENDTRPEETGGYRVGCHFR